MVIAFYDHGPGGVEGREPEIIPAGGSLPPEKNAK